RGGSRGAAGAVARHQRLDRPGTGRTTRRAAACRARRLLPLLLHPRVPYRLRRDARAVSTTPPDRARLRAAHGRESHGPRGRGTGWVHKPRRIQQPLQEGGRYLPVPVPPAHRRARRPPRRPRLRVAVGQTPPVPTKSAILTKPTGRATDTVVPDRAASKGDHM